jgi:hypothetical protein
VELCSSHRTSSFGCGDAGTVPPALDMTTVEQFTNVKLGLQPIRWQL